MSAARVLTDRVAVVTGGASGIGLAMARHFLDVGMRVVVADVEDAALARALTELDAGDRAVAARADVRRREEVEAIAETALRAFGRVDVVCSNAGVDTGGMFTQIPEASWRWVMDVNFFGAVHCAQVFLPLLEQQEWGHLITTASVAAFAPGSPMMHPYAAAKAALVAMSESLSAELRAADSAVSVSVLAPGMVRTNMTRAERNRPDDVPAQDEARARLIADLDARTQQSGLDPAVVAAQVVETIREPRFFILPHPEPAIAGVEARLERMRTGTDPKPRVAGD